MVAKVKLHVDLTGPMFQADPRKTFRQNLRQMLEGLAQQGESLVKSGFPVGPTGLGQAGVRGRVKSLTGKPWALYAVVSATHVYAWPNGGPKRYLGGKLEAKHHMFRRATSAIRATRADLAHGLN